MIRTSPAQHTFTTESHRNLIGQDKLRSTSDVKNTFKFTLLESIGPTGELSELQKLEDVWRDRLSSWVPSGLNKRED